MHPKKRRRLSPESRRDGEKDQGPVIKVVWVNDGLSRALRLFIYAALRREWNLYAGLPLHGRIGHILHQRKHVIDDLTRSCDVPDSERALAGVSNSGSKHGVWLDFSLT